MSYMLQFPPSPLPKDVSSPPFVLFGINDLDLFSDLPSNIPLALVLHFAPALRKWVLPPPEDLSASAIRMSLRTPYVGINILADMELEGLGYILARMMQLAHIKIPTGSYEMFRLMPGLLVSIAIHKAWMALELPPKGIEALYVHIQTTLMVGPPITLFDIKGVWHNFPMDSPIQREMGLNFVRNYIDRRYPASESSAIRHWYLETTERWTFFRELEKQAPAFGDVQRETMKAASERKRQEDLHIKKMFQTGKGAIASLEGEKEERHKARRERREKRDRDREERAEKRRSERARSMSFDSVSSVETAIWNPVSSDMEEEDPTTPTMDNGGPVLSHPKPVDSSDLTDLQEATTIDDRMQRPPHEAESVDFERGKLLEAIAADTRKEQERIEERNVFDKKRIAPNKTINELPIYKGDDEDFHETMEYILPDLSNLTKLKLKLKPMSNTNSVHAEKKYRARRQAMHETHVQHGILVEKALTEASNIPCRNIMPTDDSETAAIEGLHQTLEKDLAIINNALSQRTSHKHAEQADLTAARQLDENILEGPDGLVYLQPTVYKGTR